MTISGFLVDMDVALGEGYGDALLLEAQPDLLDEIAAGSPVVQVFDPGTGRELHAVFAQIDDERVAEAMHTYEYLDVTNDVVLKHGGLWFQDESFAVVRN